jgi:hypothetical protein
MKLNDIKPYPKLGEQWVEEIDGKKHMLKAVTPIINGHPYIKDLGILNEEGCLQCPFCGEYPKIIYPTENMTIVAIAHTSGEHRVLLEFLGNEQEAIDTWNRRA